MSSDSAAKFGESDAGPDEASSIRQPGSPIQPSAATKQFVCPRGHRHYEGSAFCTVCGAGPVLEDRSAAQDRLHGKYHGLRRTSDNSEVEGWYFVIREGDEAGKAALLAYADACEDYAPELAADLRKHVHDERLMDGLYEAGWER